MRKQQLIPQLTTIKHTFLIVDFFAKSLGKIDTVLQLVADLPYAFIPFTNFGQLCKVLAQEPAKTSIIIDLKS